MVVKKVYHWKHGWIPLDHYANSVPVRPLATKTNPRALPVVDIDSMPPALKSKIDKKMESLTGMSQEDLELKAQANLDKLYATGDKSSLDWYQTEGDDIGNRAEAINKEFGTKLTREQLIGMVSVTSAQKRWQENKGFAEGIARKLAADEPFEVTNTMIADYNSWAGKRRGASAHPHPELKAGTFRPSELPSDFVASKTPGMPKARNTDFAIAATKIYRNELSVNDAVNGPKQRSFVNNLSDPADERFVTVDTWHYKGVMGDTPIHGKVGDKEYDYTLDQWDDLDLTITDGRAAAYGYDPTKDRYDPANIKATHSAARNPQGFFQSGPASKADGYDGKFGTYPWFVKQTRIAAERNNVSPSGLQAVVWYGIGGGA